jgi:SAM-dependent methyltransferase
MTQVRARRMTRERLATNKERGEPTMTRTATREQTYVLGHAAEEQRRLDSQGSMLRPYTERLLREAGIGPGMRVLDAGCGTGDVAFLAAGLVGPGGAVVGVDRAAEVLATARSRAEAGDGSAAPLTFRQADLGTFADDPPFDAVVGRLVLMYQPDPAAVLRRLAGLLRPGGIFAFLEYLFAPSLSLPARPVFDRYYGWMIEAFARSGAATDLPLRFPAIFAAADLPTPEVRLDGLVFPGADPRLKELAGVVRSLTPAMERFGIATAAEIDPDTLLDRLLAEGEALGGAAWAPTVGTARVRLPGPTTA